MYKKYGIFLAAIMLMLAFLLCLDIRVNAENMKIGTVINIDSGSTLNFRNGPGTGYDIIGTLKNGQSGEILDEANASNGKLWYKMEVLGITGWASSDYIKVTEYAIEEDVKFKEYLTAQGFPESYHSQLLALHNKYPNWIFEAQHTGLGWDEVIEGESALGSNLVHEDSIASWKSVQNGAYDWENGTWKYFDSGGWVQASEGIIKYCMDPRNFLDSINIFQFIKQSYNAESLSEEQLAQKKADLTNMVADTYLAGNCEGSTYVDVIMDVAAETGVDPFALASMMIQEQGSDGSGNSISGTVSGYEGYYNYFNIGAYKSGSMSAVQRGLWYAKGAGTGATTYNRPWNTRTRSIMGGAQYYGEQFVAVGQDTLYLKKFNVQGSDLYSHQYMTNVQGAISEGQHVSDAYDENARTAALVFKIPVYENMPESVCMKPTGDDNPNYMLKSLSVSGYDLTPTFSVYETSYSLIVGNSVSSVTISAKAVANTTTISGTGTKNLSVGENVFQIKTKAQNGSSRTYTISIVREAAEVVPPPQEIVKEPSITSSAYKLNSDNTITGISDYPVNVSDFKNRFTVENGSIQITTLNGTTKTGNVGTGDQVRVYDTKGALKYTYNIIIYGELSGDGSINALDLLKIQKDILGINKLQGIYAVSADTSKDGSINALDLLQVQKQILNIKEIQQ